MTLGRNFAHSVFVDSTCVTVVLEGELDLATAPQAHAVTSSILACGLDLTLDLRELDFMAVCGARMLLELDRQAAADGTRLHIVAAPGSEVARLLDLCGVRDRLDVQTAPSAHEPAPVLALAA